MIALHCIKPDSITITASIGACFGCWCVATVPTERCVRGLACGMTRIACWLVLLACVSGSAQARDELVTSLSDAGGEPIPYILTSNGARPSQAIFLMPGGPGNLSPRMDGSQLVMSLGGNFL